MKDLVIVTGASTGIGRDISAHLAANGFEVMAGVRKASDAEAWSDFPGVTPLLLDVTQPDSVKDALSQARGKIKKARAVHLINNAGIAVAGPVEAVPMDRWREQFEVNVFGLLSVTQAFLPAVRQGSGRIVNISSVSGIAASPYLGPYAASKFAVEAISDSLRREMKQFGVKVVVVEPGPIDTPIWKKGLGRKEEMTKGISPDLVELYEKELNSFIRMAEASASGAVPVRKVSSVVLKALTSARPRTRYVVGSPSLSLQAGLLGFLPDKTVDALIAAGLRK